MNARLLIVGLALALLPAGCHQTLCPRGTRADTGRSRADQIFCAGEAAGERSVVLLLSPSGARREQCPLSNDRLDGPYAAWHDNGRLFVQGMYRQGLKHGIWTQWTADGYKVADGQYRNDQLIAGGPIAIASTCETRHF